MRDPDDVSHCRLMPIDKAGWRFVQTLLCRWWSVPVAGKHWKVNPHTKEVRKIIIPTTLPLHHQPPRCSLSRKSCAEAARNCRVSWAPRYIAGAVPSRCCVDTTSQREIEEELDTVEAEARWRHRTAPHPLLTHHPTISQSVSNWLTDWLGFDGTFSTNSPYRDFDKYVAVIKVKLMRKLTKSCWEYKKPLGITLRSGLCRGNPSTRKISRE